ncbi:MAG: hemerythrin domain-containing protein [Planctomycetes bacterium]|nr:hemerythrin domain-containing protein [Planctomycetota bacterium]
MPSCHAHLPPLDLERLSAVSVLHGEHRIILRLLDCLDRMAERAAKAHVMPVLEARDVIAVLRGFADECHHAKEERIFFPALERLAPGFGPVRVMRHEHDLGRDHVRGMAIAVDEIDVAGFVHEAQIFSDLLRQHIGKEDEVLFPMAQAMLSPEDDVAILAAYRDASRERPCGPLLARVDTLTAIYGLASADGPHETTSRHSLCGCGSGTVGICR